MESFERVARHHIAKPEYHSDDIELFIILFIFHCFFMQDQGTEIIAIALPGHNFTRYFYRLSYAYGGIFIPE
jgi:hypothetical protein